MKSLLPSPLRRGPADFAKEVAWVTLALASLGCCFWMISVASTDRGAITSLVLPASVRAGRALVVRPRGYPGEPVVVLATSFVLLVLIALVSFVACIYVAEALFLRTGQYAHNQRNDVALGVSLALFLLLFFFFWPRRATTPNEGRDGHSPPGLRP